MTELLGLSAFFALVLLLLSRMTREQQAAVETRPHPETSTNVNASHYSSKAPHAPGSRTPAS